MLAWSSPPDEREDPMSAAQLRAVNRRLAPVDNLGGSNDSPYPSFGRGHATDAGDLYSPPKKQVDRIAEAWGIHEPEPYEEFFAGGGAKPHGETGLASAASSIHGGREGPSSNGRRPIHDGKILREQFKEYLDDGRPPPVKRTPTRSLPPPQPIFVHNSTRTEPDPISSSLPSPGFSPGAPKRTKSLMHKIRKMRDSPNVPVGAEEPGEDPSPPSSLENYANAADNRPSRPTHRTNNSFFGRFGRNPSVSRNIPPTSPTSDTSEAFVYVDDPKYKNNKALPPRPHESPASPDEKNGEYFDDPSIGATPVSPGGTGGLGRRTSLLRKVKGVVRGAANK